MNLGFLRAALLAVLVAVGATAATAETCATYAPTASAQHNQFGEFSSINPVAKDVAATTYPAGALRFYGWGVLTFPAIAEGRVTRATLTLTPTASPSCRFDGEYCTDSMRALMPLAVEVNGFSDVSAFAFPPMKREAIRVALKTVGFSSASANTLRIYVPQRAYSDTTHLSVAVGGTGGRAPAARLEVCTDDVPAAAPSADAVLVAAVFGRTPEEVERDVPPAVIALIAGYLRGAR